MGLKLNSSFGAAIGLHRRSDVEAICSPSVHFLVVVIAIRAVLGRGSDQGFRERREGKGRFCGASDEKFLLCVHIAQWVRLPEWYCSLWSNH